MQQLTIPSHCSLELRNYQKKAIAQIYSYYRQGIKSVIFVSPTGSGKTLTATHIVRDAINCDCKVLFIVHREPLIDQTVKTLTRYGIASDRIGFIKAGYPNAIGNESVIVASIQTLERREFPPEIGLVIFDEAHTTSYYSAAQELIDHYSGGLLFQSKVKFLLLTATPYRTKAKQGFCHLAQRKVLAPSLKELMQLGYLVKPRHYGYGGLIDFSKLETGADGDFKKSQLKQICDNMAYNEEIVKKFVEICPDRKAIAFCGAVEQSKLLVELFYKMGIEAAHIEAATPKDRREAIFEEFKAGKIQVISSVGTLTEGFDEPSVEAVILARPTKSLALLIQMCGRGLRIHSGKEDCYLLDFGENFSRLGFIDRDREIKLCPTNKKFSNEISLKQCPDCYFLMDSFLKVCPCCGYRFESDSEEEEDFTLKQFGELLDEQTLDLVKYIRGQKKARFTRNLDPEAIWELWDKRSSTEILRNEWLYQAVFRGDRSLSAQKSFFDYLKSFHYGNEWLNFQMQLEFGAYTSEIFLLEEKPKNETIKPIVKPTTPEKIKQKQMTLFDYLDSTDVLSYSRT